MNNEDKELFQCRICAIYVADKNDRIHIFHQDVKCNYLQTKIRKYLYILVSNDDRLPKMVCSSCVKRLEGIHRFATMAHRAQERLKAQYYEISGDKNQVKDNDFDDADDDDMNENEMIKSNFIDKEIIDETNSREMSNCLGTRSIDGETNQHITEEMEVKVDPMIFLQCGLERSLSPEMSDNDDDDSDYEEKSNHIKDYFESEEIRQNYENPTKLSNNQDNCNDNSQKSYDCTICSRKFATQMSLQNHLWSHLPRSDHQYNEKPVQENIQNSVLNQDNNSSSSFDNNGTNFVCPICHKKISTKGNLKVHLETHRPKGKYGCDICGRIFKTQSNLFRHKEYHGGIQFPCSVCGRVYPTNSTLRAHSITHSDLRPHACPLCDKTFKRNQDLKFHINQHTGARPYQCPYCAKAFASSGNCFSHRKRMHPREVHRDRQRAADLMR